jgi:hypothetical protein
MATTRNSLRRRLLLLIFSPVLLAVAYCVAMLAFAVLVHATENLYWALGLGVVIAGGVVLYRRRALAKAAASGTGANPVLTAAHAYQEKSRNLYPTSAEFVAWVDSLPLLDRARAEAAGLAQSWATSFSFRRFVLEGRGHDFVDFMAETLNKQEFVAWVDSMYGQHA